MLVQSLAIIENFLSLKFVSLMSKRHMGSELADFSDIYIFISLKCALDLR